MKLKTMPQHMTQTVPRYNSVSLSNKLGNCDIIFSNQYRMQHDSYIDIHQLCYVHKLCPPTGASGYHCSKLQA